MTDRPAHIVTFDTPPVIEVVMGVQFEQRINLRTLDVAKIWENIGPDRYPSYNELRPLDPIMPANTMAFEFSTAPEFPRYLFRNAEGTNLVQLQRDRFLYNWTRTDGSGADEYPRYESILKGFFENYQVFLKSVDQLGLDKPQPAILELGYVNIIDQSLPDMGKMSSIFKDIGWMSDKDRFLPCPDRMTFAYEFNIKELSSALHVTVTPVQLVKDGRNVLKFELSVKGPLQPLSDSDMADWFTTAREWIVKGFSDLTTDAMHGQWKKK